MMRKPAHLTLQSLLATNQLSTGSLIYPGMHLRMPKGAKRVTQLEGIEENVVFALPKGLGSAA